MKKILLGILILIPIIILGIVGLVSNIAAVAAHIGVESISINLKEEYQEGNGITLSFSDVANKTISLYDYLSVEVLPSRATNKTIEWKVLDIQILDKEYEDSYNYYLEHKNNSDVAIVKPAVMLVDDNNNEVETNTSGNLIINTYCSFTIRAMAENQQDQTMFKVVGYDVEKIALSNSKENLTVGESTILKTNFTPVDSIVDKIEWYSLNEDIVKVDQNGVVKAYKEGQATVKCKAYKYTDPSSFVENSINIIVNKALSLYGNNIYSTSNTLSLSELGISSYDELNGCSALGDTLTLENSISTIKIGENLITINKCYEDDIVIDQTKTLDLATGYVVAVSNLKIKLTASYLSTFNQNKVNATWYSSNEEVASIDANGELTAKSNGLVIITAKLNNKEARIELNIQEKVTSMQLETSDSLLSVGVARETVFASHKYVDAENSNDKEFNSIDILIKGEIENASEDEIRAFYEAYNFEIVEGKEFASFDQVNTNRLVFNNSLEGKGKQNIKVKVSAKYPRYEAYESYTTQYVTIKVIYGVCVSNFTEYKQAFNDQYDYSHKEDNIIYTTNDIYVCSNLSESIAVSSYKTLAICFTDNVVYDEDVYTTDIKAHAYGDIYGNNHMVSAKKEQTRNRDDGMIYVSWSNINISNLIVRVNDLGDNTEITTDEASVLLGQALWVHSEDDYDKYRLQNISIEYCILENARCSCRIDGADVYMKGCIIRNMSNVGMCVLQKIRTCDGNVYIMPVNLTVENMIYSNCLGTAIDLETSKFEIDDVDTSKYRFADSKEENDKYIMENLVSKGLNGSFTQKGFLDIYNWISTEDVTLVTTGEDAVDNLIKAASSSILGTDPSLVEYRYRYKSVDYFHLGFMLMSMDPTNLGNKLTLNETVWMDISLEDERFSKFSLSEIQEETIGSIIKNFGVSIYAYKNTSDLKPSSTYVINDKLIDKLHG